MEKFLEIKNLKKYFKTPKGILHAVDGVSFSIVRGETFGIVGESGCGKSTLGRLILHLLDLTGGQMVFEGRDITFPDKREIKVLRQEMQMIFQDPYSSINPRMTAGEIITEPLEIFNLYSSTTERREKASMLMETVGLADRVYNAYPHELDGGRRQRIGIARALALNPKFIVCDEPVSALDVSIQAQILNLMQDLQMQRGLTYIFITHDLSVVHHISNNIGVMYLGELVETSTSKELFKNPLHPYTKALLSAIPRPDIHNKIKRILLKGEISSPIDPDERCRFSARCNDSQEKCLKCHPKLIEAEPNHFVACHFYGKI
jgi:peptide/nickel transport system ATP-binding protein